MPVLGAQLVAKNIIAYGGGFTKSVNKVMTKVSNILDKQVTVNLKANYFTLEDLKRLDHPYAARHGSRGKAVPDPYYKAHERTGKLLSSKFSGVNEASVFSGSLKAEAYVGLDANKVKYALNIVYGTSRMIPRPVLQGSKDQVAEQAYTLISTTLKNLKVKF